MFTRNSGKSNTLKSLIRSSSSVVPSPTTEPYDEGSEDRLHVLEEVLQSKADCSALQQLAGDVSTRLSSMEEQLLRTVRGELRDAFKQRQDSKEDLQSRVQELSASLRSTEECVAASCDSLRSRADAFDADLKNIQHALGQQNMNMDLATTMQRHLECLRVEAQQGLDATAQLLTASLQAVADAARTDHDALCALARSTEYRFKHLTDSARSDHDAFCIRAETIENNLLCLTTDLQKRMDGAETKLTADLTSVADEARADHDRMSLRIGDIELNLRCAVEKSERELGAATQKLSVELQATTDKFCARAEEIELNFQDMLAKKEQKFDKSAQKFSVDLQAAADAAKANHDIICSRAAAMEKHLQDMHAETEEKFDFTAQIFSVDLQAAADAAKANHDTVCSKATAMELKLQDMHAETEQKMDVAAQRFAANLQAAADAAKANHDTVCSRAAAMELKLQDMHAETEQKMDEVAQRFAANLQAAADAAKANHEAICTQVASIEVNMQKMAVIAVKTEQKLAVTAENLTTDLRVVADAAKADHDTVCKRSATIELDVQSVAAKTQLRLDAAVEKMLSDVKAAAFAARADHDAVSARAEVIESDLQHLADRAERQLDAATQKSKIDLQAAANAARADHDMVCAKAQTIEASLTNFTTKTQQNLDAVGLSLQCLQEASEAARSGQVTLGAQAAKIERHVESAVMDLQQKLENVAQESAATVRSLTDITRAELDTLFSKTGEIVARIDKMAASYSLELATSVAQLERKLTANLTQLQRSIERSGEVAKADRDNLNKLSATMQSSYQTLAQEAKADCSKLVSKLDMEVSPRLEDFQRCLNMKADVGTLYLQGNQKAVKQLDANWNHCVDWDVSGMDFSRCRFPQSVDSPEFGLGCLNGLRLRFQACWDAQGTTSLLAVVAPKGSDICCRLSVDSCTKEACLLAHAEDNICFYGATFPQSKGHRYSTFHVELVNARLAASKARTDMCQKRPASAR